MSGSNQLQELKSIEATYRKELDEAVTKERKRYGQQQKKLVAEIESINKQLHDLERSVTEVGEQEVKDLRERLEHDTKQQIRQLDTKFKKVSDSARMKLQGLLLN